MLTSVILEQNVLQKWNILFCGLYKVTGVENIHFENVTVNGQDFKGV